MKRIIQRELAQRKRRIIKRLEKALEQDGEQPTLKPTNIVYELGERTRAISHGGIGVVKLLCQMLGPARTKKWIGKTWDIVKLWDEWGIPMKHDGEWIYFDRLEPDGFWDVYRVRPDGSEEVCLTCDAPELPNRHQGQPVEQEDGSHREQADDQDRILDMPLDERSMKS